MKHSQQIVVLFCLLLLSNSIFCNKHHSTNKAKNKNKGTNVVFQSWVHYFHENYIGESRPKNFFENSEFFQQRIRKSEKDKSDENGMLAIPDRSSYYLVLYPHSAAFFTARNKIERKTVESFQIEHLELIPEDIPKLGSVKDMGKVDKFYCISIKMQTPNKLPDENQVTEKTREKWTLCFNDENSKRKFMSIIIDMKIKQQRAAGIMITAEQLPEEDKPKKKEEGPVDSKLVLLSDWSECTLKCGGGKSYQQYMCIPGNGGEACPTDLIKSKDCNTQPCPLAKEVEEKKEEKGEYIKPILKIGPYSKRHRRNLKCIIKNGEAYREEKDPESGEINTIPTVIEMNNNALTIYEDETHDKLIHAFQLEKTTMTREKDICTLSIMDNVKKIVLKGFDQDCGTPEEDLFVKGWIKDFNLFKYECKFGREEVLIDQEAQKKIDEMAKKNSEIINVERQQENAEKVRDQFSSNQQSSLAQNLASTKKTTLKAISKENQIESMILEEEKEREELELSTIKDQIQKEKQKSDNLRQSIKEKELDDVFIEQERQSESEVLEAKQEAKEKISEKRNNLADKIKKMRKLAQMKKGQLMNSLKKAKTKLADSVIKATKIGSSEACNKGKVEDKQDIRDGYCNKAFQDDFFLNLECKNVETFCYTCCETEFGKLHLDKREDCYNECDGIKSAKPAENAAKAAEKKTIKWLWKAKAKLV